MLQVKENRDNDCQPLRVKLTKILINSINTPSLPYVPLLSYKNENLNKKTFIVYSRASLQNVS